MNGIHGLYQNSYYGGNVNRTAGKQDAAVKDAQNAAYGMQAAAYEKSKEVAEAENAKPVELSEKARELLKRLQEKYGDTEFVIADYSSESEAQRLLSGGSKEFSVLITPELLEDMAADDAVLEKYEGILNDSRNQIEEMVKQLGEDGTKVSSVGVALGNDGEISFFAELDKVNAKQRERIEKAREEKKKTASKQEKAEKEESVSRQQKVPGKKVRVSAGSVEELLTKIREANSEETTDTQEATVGKRIDYSV